MALNYVSVTPGGHCTFSFMRSLVSLASRTNLCTCSAPLSSLLRSSDSVISSCHLCVCVCVCVCVCDSNEFPPAMHSMSQFPITRSTTLAKETILCMLCVCVASTCATLQMRKSSCYVHFCFWPLKGCTQQVGKNSSLRLEPYQFKI